MSVLTDLGDRLTSQSVATQGTDLFLGVLPSTPDACTALLLTGGGPASRAMSAGPGTALVERPHVQCITRASRPDDALKRAQDVWFALDHLGAVTINGVAYLHVEALQSPFELGRDEAGRFIFAVNFEVVRVPATSS